MSKISKKICFKVKIGLIQFGPIDKNYTGNLLTLLPLFLCISFHGTWHTPFLKEVISLDNSRNDHTSLTVFWCLSKFLQHLTYTPLSTNVLLLHSMSLTFQVGFHLQQQPFQISVLIWLLPSLLM